MNTIRKLPAQTARVETGPVQFGEDWPGVFIRGDGAAWYAMMLARALSGRGKDSDPMVWLALENLRTTLADAVVGPARDLLESGRATEPPQVDPCPRCRKCGLLFEGSFGYVCPNPDCPCGLGGTVCTYVSSTAQDPVIGN